MSAPLLSSLEVTTCALEVPVEDFEHLPRELGCSLHRHGEHLTLACEQPGCEVHFEVEGEFAYLCSIDLKDDPQGRFFRDVVGLLLQLYGGDLEAQMRWSPPGPDDGPIEVRNGETSHPVLFESPEEPPDATPPPVDVSMPMVEQWLADAEAAWAEYQRHKQSREKQSQSLT